ncbi:MAG: DNA-directed RNA polymerase subunit omega [Clostridia bacterium]|nr:DNA-directed RNA polymerase subunit omega [Clostridia bacterium]
MVKPAMPALLKKITNKYSLVVGTAKRARQISLGSPKLTDVKVESDVTTAAIEIDEGKITLKK